MNERIQGLLASEDDLRKKLNEIVLKAIEEEKLISEKLYEAEDKHISFGNRIADKVAGFGGSWAFIISFFFILMLWIVSNVYLLSRPFDPYPFILLNLILSCI